MSFYGVATTEIYTLSLHDALPIYEWEAFKKVISRRNIRRRITIPLTLSNLKLLRRITRTENILHRNLRLLRVSGIVIDRKSGSAGMPRPISYAVFCLKKKRDHR